MTHTIKIQDEVYNKLLKFMDNNKNKKISNEMPYNMLGIGGTAGYLILRGIDNETNKK